MLTKAVEMKICNKILHTLRLASKDHLFDL